MGALLPLHFNDGIMGLFNVDAEKVLAGEVSAACHAAICVEAAVVCLVCGVGVKGHLGVRR